MADAKNINCNVTGKVVQDNLVRLEVGKSLQSDMARLTTDELLRLLHSLGHTGYTEITEESHGFPYTFPIVFGY